MNAISEFRNDSSKYSSGMVIDLRAFLSILHRRIFLIGLAVVISVILGLFVVGQITPLYSATTAVKIGGRDDHIVEIEEVLTELGTDEETIQTEIQVIRSRNLIGRIVDKLELDHYSEFNPALTAPSITAPRNVLRQILPDTWVDVLTPSSDSQWSDDPTRQERMLREQVVDSVLSRFVTNVIGRSHVLQLTFQSEDPETAAAVVNGIAELYIVAQLEAKFEATDRANIWLADRLATLRKRAEVSDRAVEAFRREHEILDGRLAALESEEISGLTAQLVLERVEGAELEARLREVNKLLSSNSRVDSLSEVQTSSLIVALREQEAEVKRKVAELAEIYGDKHPQMGSTRAELRDIEGKIQIEVNRIVQSLRNEVSVARAREASLQSALRKLKSEIGEMNEDQVQLRALERESEANRLLLESYLIRSKETENYERVLSADATILSHAAVPKEANSPNKKRALAISVVIGLALGCTLAIGREMLDRTYRGPDQIEIGMGLPVLCQVPAINGFAALSRRPKQYLLPRPNSPYAEALRDLRTKIMLSDLDHPPKVILIASSLPMEGKSMIARSLAIQVAELGKKVMLLDTDLRRPTLHKITGTPLQPGITDLLAGQTQYMEQLPIRELCPNCHYITAGSQCMDPPDLLGSSKMKNLLAFLSETYDLVILDSPPILAVADTKVMSRLADKTIFLVRWAKHPRDVANKGVRQLLDVGADIAGVAMTMVDTRQHAFYGHGNSNYHNKLKKYYTG